MPVGRILGDVVVLTSIGRTVREAREQVPALHASYALDAFVVMPNHLHAIVVQEAMNDRTSLSTVIGLLRAVRAAARGVRSGSAAP